MGNADQRVALVSLERLSYQYPRTERLALHDIDLEIYESEFLGIIGATGAGKTTLCLALNGIVPQFYGGRFFGRVRVMGLDTVEQPIAALAAHVGMVFEDPETQLTATSVENEIAFALENLNVPREEILARIPRALEAVRLSGAEKRHPHELSGGQKQRLAIAAALALRPQLLVLDEPTSQLDPMGAEDVFATVRALNKELGMTIVMASHAAEELAEYADRLALLEAGRLVRVGAPEAVYTDWDALQRNALRPPQVAETFMLLKNFDVPIAKAPVRLQEGLRALEALKAARAHPLTPLDLPPSQRERRGPPLLSAQNLHHHYSDGTAALRGVSLDIDEGEYVLIIGQNGAGKSSLVKHFLHLLEPTQGAVLVGGEDTRQLRVSDLAQRIGYVAQNPDQQIFNASVWDEVTFALKNLGYPKAEIEARAAESLEAMGLWEARERHPLALPKGDRARVVIAAMLALQPQCLIFDEPTTGQDYRGARYILEITRALHRAGKTIIVITHHLYLMPEYAERVIVMGQGVKLLDAPIREAFHALELLRSTYLTPPQAVLLARALGGEENPRAFPLLTPKEVVACLAQ